MFSTILYEIKNASSFFIIMAKSLSLFSPEKQKLLDMGKTAFLQFVAERKDTLHNYQRRSMFWDREHLYSENLMLRNKIKQLATNNSKTKTQLLKSEKQMMNLTIRRKSNQNFSSLTKPEFRKDQEISFSKWKEDNPEEKTYPKKYLEMKKIIRRLKEEIDKLQAENGELKKSIKYTRMNQLQIQNIQLQEQITRMKKIANNSVAMYDQLQQIYKKQKYEIDQKLRKEVQARGQLNRQLKKVKQELHETDVKLKSSRSNIKLINQIEFLRRENDQLKDVLEINIKNNSQLKETLQSYIKNSQPRQAQIQTELYVTRLDYSNSIISVYPESGNKMNQSPAKMGYGNGLTSLELLTPKPNLDDVRSPQNISTYKMSDKIHQDPHNEEQQQTYAVSKQIDEKKADIKMEQTYLQELEQIPVKEKDQQFELQDIIQQEM